MSAPAGAPPARRVPVWRRALRPLWLVAVVVALVVVLRARGGEVAAALEDLDRVALLVAFAAVTAGIGASGAVWRTMLAGLGSPIRPRAALRVFFVGQLGKYLPGSVWPVLAQVEMGRDLAVPARASAGAYALFMAVHVITAVLVAVVALPAAGLLPWAVAVLALPLAALLVPGPLGWLLATALRLARRAPLPTLPGGAVMVRATCWAAVMWAAWGLHVHVLMRGIGGEVGGVEGYLAAAGTYAAAWVAGFLFLVAPAGAGVREAVFVALLAGQLAAGPALAVVLVSRLLGTVGDAVWGAAGLVWGRLGERR